MNRDRIEGSWKQLKGRVIEQWYSLSDDRGGMLAGRREQIAGRMQNGYGLSVERSARQLNEWRSRMRYQWPLSNARSLMSAAAGGAPGAMHNAAGITNAKLHLVRS